VDEVGERLSDHIRNVICARMWGASLLRGLVCDISGTDFANTVALGRSSSGTILDMKQESEQPVGNYLADVACKDEQGTFMDK